MMLEALLTGVLTGAVMLVLFTLGALASARWDARRDRKRRLPKAGVVALGAVTVLGAAGVAFALVLAQFSVTGTATRYNDGAAIVSALCTEDAGLRVTGDPRDPAGIGTCTASGSGKTITMNVGNAYAGYAPVLWFAPAVSSSGGTALQVSKVRLVGGDPGALTIERVRFACVAIPPGTTAPTHEVEFLFGALPTTSYPFTVEIDLIPASEPCDPAAVHLP
jgi:microcystin degradation protein MlrC